MRKPVAHAGSSLTILPLAVGSDGETHAVRRGEVPSCQSSPHCVMVLVFPDVF